MKGKGEDVVANLTPMNLLSKKHCQKDYHAQQSHSASIGVHCVLLQDQHHN